MSSWPRRTAGAMPPRTRPATIPIVFMVGSRSGADRIWYKMPRPERQCDGPQLFDLACLRPSVSNFYAKSFAPCASLGVVGQSTDPFDTPNSIVPIYRGGRRRCASIRCCTSRRPVRADEIDHAFSAIARQTRKRCRRRRSATDPMLSWIRRRPSCLRRRSNTSCTAITPCAEHAARRRPDTATSFDLIDGYRQHRRIMSDQILKGAKLAELPVRAADQV